LDSVLLPTLRLKFRMNLPAEPNTMPVETASSEMGSEIAPPPSGKDVVLMEPSREWVFWTFLLQKFVFPAKMNPFAKFMQFILVTPTAAFAWCSLDEQRYLYEVVHQTLKYEVCSLVFISSHRCLQCTDLPSVDQSVHSDESVCLP